MPVTLNNFWGAETGGGEEAYIVAGTNAIVSSSNPASGTYCYTPYGAAGSNYFIFDITESIPDAGGGCILGCKVWRDSSNIPPGITIQDSSSNFIARILWYSVGSEWRLHDINITTLDTYNDTGFGAYRFFEFYFVPSTGVWAWFVDGVSLGAGTGATFDTNGRPKYVRITGGGASAGDTGRWDDIYFMTGCSSEDDRLGGCDVYAYRSNLNSATPDVGTALGSGTWLATQTIPFSASIGGILDGDQIWGYINTDDVGGSAGTGGPSTDANITGSIVASKGTFKLSRGNGGGTNHYIQLHRSSNTAGVTGHPGFHLRSLTTSAANYYCINQAQDYWFPMNYSSLGQTASKSATHGPTFTFSSDGNYLFAASTNGTVIYRHAFSTAWDITTINATADQSLDVDAAVDAAWGAGDWNAGGFDFTEDGTKLYVGHNVKGSSGRYIYEYSLSTAWDLSTATINSTTRLDISSNVSFITCIRLRDSDTKLFCNGNGRQLPGGQSSDYDENISRFDFSSPGIANLSYSQQADLMTEASGSYAAAWAMSHDGRSVIAHNSDFGNFDNTSPLHFFDLWELPTPFDLSTAVYWGKVPSGQGTGNSDRQCDIRPDDRAFYEVRGATYDELTSAIIPTTSQYMQIGGAVDGAQDLEIWDMLATVLHVPPAAAGSFPPFNPMRRMAPRLVR